MTTIAQGEDLIYPSAEVHYPQLWWYTPPKNSPVRPLVVVGVLAVLLWIF